MDEIGRRRPAKGVHNDLGAPTIVFLTVCTKDRVPWLACLEAHDALVAAWSEADAWLVGLYVVMPDHVHLFCAPTEKALPLENWVRFWKARFTRRLANRSWRWQAHHWDTRLRRSESYAAKWAYVRENPVRAGLVAVAEDWPWQGERNVLRW